MFGRNNDDDSSQQDTTGATDGHAISPVADQTWQHPGEPLETSGHTPEPETPTTPSSTGEISSMPAPSAPPIQTAVDEPAEPTEIVAETVKPEHHDLIDSSPNDLIDIKQKALGELNPLMGHLDQTPEEKFRTTMMMIQASDDQTLVKVAYEAAQQITDEKTRAQALLDIVNEINYFTQQHTN